MIANRLLMKFYIHDSVSKQWHRTTIMVSKITGNYTVCSIVCLGIHQTKHQSFSLLVLLRGIHQSLVDSPHKGPVMRKVFCVISSSCASDFALLGHGTYAAAVMTKFWYYILCTRGDDIVMKSYVIKRFCEVFQPLDLLIS